jgi:hypothetical protein
MVVTVAYRIMHAPWSDRAPWLQDIRRQVPSAETIEDERHDLWDTARRAWLSGAEDIHATHVMVLQDDMIPCVGFSSILRRIVTQKPDAAISVFAFPGAHWAAVQQYGGDGKPGWRSCGGSFWGGSIILPRARVEEMIAYADTLAHQGDHDDARIGEWARHSGIECAHWYPQLVEHVGWATSLIGHDPGEWRRGVVA